MTSRRHAPWYGAAAAVVVLALGVLAPMRAQAITYYNLTHQVPDPAGGYGTPNPVDGSYPYSPPLPPGTSSTATTSPSGIFYKGAQGIFTTDVGDYANYNPIVGTGVLQPFIRIQPDGKVNTCGNPCTEAGYNTDGGVTPNPGKGHVNKPQYQGKDNEGTNWNHALKLENIGIYTDASGVKYREFILDINESKGGKNALDQQEYLSLDKFKLYMASTGNLDNLVINNGGANADDYDLVGATKIYDIDTGAAGGAGDSSIGLNYALQDGSGNGIDLVVRIPDTLFNPALGPYVYLYSSFGEVGVNDSSGATKPSGACQASAANTCTNKLPSGDFSQSAGFEEWSSRANIVKVPAPSSLLLLLLGAAAASVCFRRRVTALTSQS